MECPPGLRCTRCGQSPGVVAFSPDANTTSGFRHWCNECGAEYARQRRASRRSRWKAEAEEKRQPVPPSHFPTVGIIEDRPGPDERLPREGLSKVLAIPDVHYPFHSERWQRRLLELVGDEKPDLVVQLGDLYDLLSFSKYPRSFNVYTPKDEITEARALAESMWATIRHRSPKSRCVQLRGNHDDRAHKRVVEALPAIEHLVMPALNALFQFEGVETVDSSREEFVFEGVRYHHGHQRFGGHVIWNLENTANGHLHRGGVVFKQTERGTIWELNAGFGGDVEAPCFTYGALKRMHGTTLGAGWIDSFGPRFVPFS